MDQKLCASEDKSFFSTKPLKKPEVTDITWSKTIPISLILHLAKVRNEHVLQTTGKLQLIWPNRNFLSTFLCVLQSLNWIKVNPPLD